MAALREAPRIGGLLGTLSRAPNAVCARRFASTESVAKSAKAEISDIETSSSLEAPVVGPKDVKLQNPRRRASRRSLELPHGRYQFHAPKYYRGPMHPVQPPKSSDPIARDYSPGPFNLPRLQQTWDASIASDIMTMAYQHVPPGTPAKPERVRLRKWDDSSPYMENRPLRGPRGSDVLFPLEKDITWRNIPKIKAVHLSVFQAQARKNFDHIIVGRSILQTITGVRPTTTLTKQSVAQWNLIKGEKGGLKVSLYGNQALEFVDKLITLVLPKIKEWEGVRATSGDSTGNIGLGLEPSQVMHFPEVEANYGMYPAKMIPGFRIILETTATSDRHARLLCQAIGVPFYGKVVD
ncbi:ribosomal L5P family protein [Microdochium trichocladiopsis]|uniref:Ribosomal L5P family protein n=1 Tax=Microdochium trichocladiopsis TaxID=1682393 RepID=A0A9P8Y9E4_9PEZI|nr:ribosomal L5P family protein [Microdochium trichocladiopsis]KAH7033126.1 ribosomal L5P family protein [Microdochium trichocladiopsis]